MLIITDDASVQEFLAGHMLPDFVDYSHRWDPFPSKRKHPPNDPGLPAWQRSQFPRLKVIRGAFHWKMLSMARPAGGHEGARLAAQREGGRSSHFLNDVFEGLMADMLFGLRAKAILGPSSSVISQLLAAIIASHENRSDRSVVRLLDGGGGPVPRP